MKYRIVETEEGFIVQERVFFRWRDVKENGINKCTNGWYVTASKERLIWHSIDKAKEHLYAIRKRAFKYRGHVIEFSLGLDSKLYYYEKRTGKPFPVVSDYDDLKKYIDMIEDEKERKTKILKIYDEHGNIRH